MILDVHMYVETRKDDANLIPEAGNIPLLRLLWNLEELPWTYDINPDRLITKRTRNSD